MGKHARHEDRVNQAGHKPQEGHMQQAGRQSQKERLHHTEHMQQAGQIWICPTPIGNLDDMTPRALKALAKADIVCAEDTRVTGKLLHAFDIHAHLMRMDENTIAEKAPGVVERVLRGENVAFCSDAGMPGVSDPGMHLVHLARAAGISVSVLPGPTAGATAYVASGFTCPHYLFYGFFPRKPGQRAHLLASLAPVDAALVFYESPRRLVGALASIADVFPTRNVAVCRELTKVHEEIVVDTASHVYDEFARRAKAGALRGEIVIVVDAAGVAEKEQQAQQTETDAHAYIHDALAHGQMSKRDLADDVAKRYHLSRTKAYHMVQSQA